MSEVWNCEERLHHNIYHLVISSYLENFLQTFFLQTNTGSSFFFLHTKASLWFIQSAGFVRNCKQENNLIWQGLCKTFFVNAHILLLLTQSTWPSMGVVIDPVGQRLKIAAQVYLVNLLKFMQGPKFSMHCKKWKEERAQVILFKFLYLTTLWLWFKCEQHLNRIWGVFCYLFWFGE